MFFFCVLFCWVFFFFFLPFFKGKQEKRSPAMKVWRTLTWESVQLVFNSDFVLHIGSPYNPLNCLCLKRAERWRDNLQIPPVPRYYDHRAQCTLHLPRAVRVCEMSLQCLMMANKKLEKMKKNESLTKKSETLENKTVLLTVEASWPGFWLQFCYEVIMRLRALKFFGSFVSSLKFSCITLGGF